MWQMSNPTRWVEAAKKMLSRMLYMREGNRKITNIHNDHQTVKLTSGRALY